LEKPLTVTTVRPPGARSQSLRKFLICGWSRVTVDADDHVTAEQLHGEAVEAAVRVSLATVYNTLHQFIEAGLLREVVVNSGRSYFDTNVSDHHHFFFEDTGRLLDIPGEYVAVSGLPKLPAGAAISRIDVIVRVGRDLAPAAD